MSSIVYFLRRSSNRLIKIGRSSHFVSRFKTLCREYGEHLEILGIVPEERFLEADLHKLFRNFRAKDEWFVETKGIRDFIRDHAEPYDPARHGGKGNEVFMKLDRGLANRVKGLAERQGVTPGVFLENLLHVALDETSKYPIDSTTRQILSGEQ